VICEVLPCGPVDALHAVLEPLGYRYLLLTPAGAEPRDTLTPDPVWRNFMLVPDG
jgi:hypothetical protein